MVYKKYSDNETYLDLVFISPQEKLSEKKINLTHIFSRSGVGGGGGGVMSTSNKICLDLHISILGKGQLQIPFSTYGSQFFTMFFFKSSKLQ